MRITVIGSGYVGLVAGTCFAETGNDVICVDNDEAKIAALKDGIIPIYEPGLEELVKRNVAEGRLTFSTDTDDAVKRSLICFIAVGTPPEDDGSSDLRAVWLDLRGNPVGNSERFPAGGELCKARPRPPYARPSRRAVAFVREAHRKGEES